MHIIERLRAWWQLRTGEEDTPFDGDAPAWVVSLLVHVLILVAVAIFGFLVIDTSPSITMEMAEDEPEEIIVPQEFYFSEQPSDRVGANSQQNTDMALAQAPVLHDISQVPTPELEVADFAKIELQEQFELPSGPNISETVLIRGAVGVGTTGAEGAIDRITHEIMLSLEERKTLVVWLFDQSGSLALQRERIMERFDRVYEELGIIEAAGNPAFSQYENKPLLSSVVAFGDTLNLLTDRPTDDLALIRQAVEGITEDTSGVERSFQAIYATADKFKELRRANPETGQPERNVMIVMFSDEVGDDYNDPNWGLEPCVDICRRYEIPVYVVGVPSPFGREETEVKWLDREFEVQYPGQQQPQWGRVNQGPETLFPERLKLYFAGQNEDRDPIDSGFGPFALTRLCYETGGIYFTVHPNRHVERQVSRGETDAFSAHFEHFFDPGIMRRYRPDYVSIEEYQRRLMENRCRMALVEASSLSWTSDLSEPQLRFIKRDEASFATELSEAQKQAAKLQPQVDRIYQILVLGEEDREREYEARWEAGFDLAMGRVLAVKVRTESYNLMLAGAKRGDLPMAEGNENSWYLQGSEEVSVGSQHARLAERSRMYLQRVVDEHPGTPWALLAQRELETPVSWEWVGFYTDLTPPPPAPQGGNGGNPVGRDDEVMRIERPKPQQAPPL